MALGAGVVVSRCSTVAGGASRDRQLADPQPARLRRVRGHRAVPVRHPARARAPRPRAVLPLLRADRSRAKKSIEELVGRRRHARRASTSARSSPSSAQIGLRNYIEGGIPLDAMLTYDLLVSIFQPTSPLHDGAVIVQDDRVAAAACFLPLTVNPQLEQGARLAASRRDRPHRGERRRRHRRLRGDRQRSRSWSTARSSAASTPDALRQRLGQLIAYRRGRRSVAARARRERNDGAASSRDFGLKALSIALAVVLWIVVAGEQTGERSLRVPLEFQNIPESLEMTGEPPSAVDVRVRGAVGHAWPSCAAATDRRSSICARRAPGKRLFHLTPDRGARAVRRRGRAGAAVDGVDGVRDVGAASACRSCRAVEGTPAPGFVVGPVAATAERASR